MMELLSKYILSINIFSPLIGVLFILLFSFFGNYDKSDGRSGLGFKRLWLLIVGLCASSISLIITGALFCDSFLAKFNLIVPLKEKFQIFNTFGFGYSLNVDGISLIMMMLSSFIIIISLIVFWSNKNYSTNRPALAICMMLILQTCCLGAFSTSDLVLFYVFFEASLIPMIFIIGIWGREKRVYAALKLFIYTAFGSIFFLFVILCLKYLFGVTDIDSLVGLTYTLSPSVQKVLWIMMFIAFAVKIPMLPFHTWLPDAHVQAPTFGSIILAGVLIKMGGYAMIKFLIPLFPAGNEAFGSFAVILSIIAIIYGSLMCIVQADIKKLIAYSSIAHMGYVTFGLFAGCGLGHVGAVFQMVSHGFISGALFLSVGIIYEKLHTLEISKIHSLASKMPLFAMMFMIFTLGSVGFPGTSGFIGEFLVILSAVNRDGGFIYGLFAATGVVLGAVYMLVLYRRIFLQKALSNDISMVPDKDTLIRNEATMAIGNDINYNANLKTSKLENSLLLVFSALVLYFGLRPATIFNMIEKKSVQNNCNISSENISNTKSAEVLSSLEGTNALPKNEVDKISSSGKIKENKKVSKLVNKEVK